MGPLVISAKVWRHRFDATKALDGQSLLRALHLMAATDSAGGRR